MSRHETKETKLLLPLVALLCIACCVSCKEKAGRALPSGWSLVNTPTLDSPMLQCANYSKQSWKVSSIKDAIGIEDSQPLRLAQALPDNFKRTADMVGNSSAVELTDGFLIGFDGGEFGGGLWRSQKDGSSVTKLLDAPVRSLMATSKGVLVFTGTAHMGLDNGQAWILRNIAEDRQPALLLELDGAPQVLFHEGGDSVLVVTTHGVTRVTPEGRTEVLTKAPFQSLYPASVAETSDHQIYVGMRMFVVQLSPNGSGYAQQWFVRSECRETRVDGHDCTCTAPKSR